MKKLNKKQKIIACVGNVSRKSIPKVVGCNNPYVSMVLVNEGITLPPVSGSIKTLNL